jgi:hypothetical protein
MEEIDTEVRVVALHRLRNVLDDRDVKGNGDSEDGKNYRLVLFVCNK